MEVLCHTRNSIAPQATTTIDLPRFGPCTYTDSEIINFPWGLPGFMQLRRFLAISVDAEESYFWLHSLDDLGVALPMCNPWSIFDDYDVPLPPYATQSLGIQQAESACVMCVLVASKAGGTTINLLAPIVINLEKQIGRQVTLENQRYSVRTPVPSVAFDAAVDAAVDTKKVVAN